MRAINDDAKPDELPVPSPLAWIVLDVVAAILIAMGSWMGVGGWNEHADARAVARDGVAMLARVLAVHGGGAKRCRLMPQ